VPNEPLEILDEIFFFLFFCFRVFLFASPGKGGGKLLCSTCSFFRARKPEEGCLSTSVLEGIEESALELAESACTYVRPDGLEEQAVLVRVMTVSLVVCRVPGARPGSA
jgi:hypothetical protein